jgi:hypothetical protein
MNVVSETDVNNVLLTAAHSAAHSIVGLADKSNRRKPRHGRDWLAGTEEGSSPGIN